jgi:putative hydrolase of the HAD superfamily
MRIPDLPVGKVAVNLTSLRIVLFDLDDTLYPECDYVYSGFQAVAEWAEKKWSMEPSITFSEFSSFFQAGYRNDVFQWWLAEKNLPDSYIADMLHVLRTHAPRIFLRPEALALLDRLRRDGIRLGLVTEGRRAVQEAKIKSLELDQWLQAAIIMGEDEVAHWKPSRIPFERALAGLASSAEQAAYVGDNPKKDFRGARSLGMYTIRVRYPDGRHFQEEPATPADAADREVANLKELSEFAKIR